MPPLTIIALLMSAAPAPEDAKLAAAFRSYLDDECRRHPLFATRQGNHEYDDQLDDLSPAARADDLARTRALLADLPKRINVAGLTRAGQIDFEIWTHALKADLWREENEHPFETDPRVYGEYLSDSVFLLLTQSTLPRERNVANAAKRMRLLPKVVAAAKASLKNPPRVLTEVAIKRARAAVGFYEKDIFALAGETPGVGPLAGGTSGRAAKAVAEYADFLEKEVLPRSGGEWRIGKEKFAAKLAMELDAGLTADELVAAAEAEADRVEREMWYVAKQQWAGLFPGRPLPPDDPAGRRTCVKQVLDELGKDHGTAENLVADATKTVADIKRFIRDRHILTLPDPDACRIVAMPEFQRGFSVAYLNPAPPLDPSAASLYAVAPPPADWPDARKEAFLREYNRAMLKILTIHEAYPGHYVQLAYANRHPSLVRKVLYSGVFAEGWAVYTEQTMLDQGYGNGDLSLRLHQLKFYLRAVLNAILDYRMHCAAMTDDEALKLLMDRGFQTEGEAVGKVLRAKQSTCQLSTYFAGRTAFYRLRQQVQRARGESFDLGKYHEEVLGHGTIPVKYLPGLVK